MTIQSINSPDQLLEIAPQSTPYLFPEFIKTDKWRERRLSKRKLKVLKAVDPTITKILRPNEQVFYLTDGLRNSTLEQLFVGWVAYYYNLMAFVFTSERILLIHLKSRKAKGVYLGSIDYADIRQVKTTLLGNLQLKFTNGKSLLFTRMPRADKKRIKNYMNSVLGETITPINKAGHSMKHLCPTCTTSHIKVMPTCSECSTTFKKPGTAALLSFIMPGLGDLYLHSKVLGTLELIGMAFIWTSLILGTQEAIEQGEAFSSAIAVPITFFVFVHSIDALKSAHMGRKGLIPTKQK